MTLTRDARSPRESVPAALASALLVGGMAAGLTFGLGSSVAGSTVTALRSIVFPPDRPPPPPARRPHHAAAAPARPSGSAGAAPAPPVPVIPLVVPLTIPPVPQPATGTLVVPGTGSGAGNDGMGPGGGGTGGNGKGSGDSGPAVAAVQVAGRLSARDLPRDVLQPGGELAVSVAYVVGTDGRVRDCAITASSGYQAVDLLVCRLLVERFRYRPARDGAGRPVPAPVRETHSWARRADPPSSAR